MNKLSKSLQNLSTTKIKLLKELYAANDGLLAFHLFKRSGLTYPIFTNNIFTLINENYITEKNGKLFLSTEIRQASSFPRIAITISNDRPWRRVPERFQSEPYPVNAPYVPSKRLYS